jgi:hypothetical protein
MSMSRAIDKGRVLRTLCSADSEKLLQFYLGMNFQQRRARFGAAVSNESIERFCRGIDWTRIIVVGRERSYCLEAVIEIHPLVASWDIAEIALANMVPAGRSRIIAELLQIAAFAAGRRGCSMLKMLGCSDLAELLPILWCMGNVVCEEDCVSVGLEDYVSQAWTPLTNYNSNCNHV